MATAFIDRIDTLEMEEVNGVIRKLTRKARVCGLVGFLDFNVLPGALQQAGIPSPGSTLIPSAAAYDSVFGMLVLANRSIKLVDGDNGTVDVTLEYQHFLDGDNQYLGVAGTTNSSGDENDTDGSSVETRMFGANNIFGKHKSSVQQTKTNYHNITTPVRASNGAAIPDWTIATNRTANIGDIVFYNGFYWKYAQFCGPRNFGNHPPPALNFLVPSWVPAVPLIDIRFPSDGEIIKQQIIVAHTFPYTDPQVPSQTLFQTGEISVMQPHSNYSVQGHVYTASPWLIEDQVLGGINSDPWQNAPALQWMCTEVTWEAIFATRKYKMGFEFQRNPDTWVPTAIFNDQRNGRPPVNLVQGFGYRSIYYHKEMNFDDFFQTVFEM